MTPEKEDPFEGFISEAAKVEVEGSGRRTTIEAQGRQWAQKRAEAMRAGALQPVVVMRLDGEYQRIRNLPTLTGRKRPSDPPYDEQGNLWIITWPEVSTEVGSDGQRYSLNPKGYEYEILNPRTVRTKDLNRLPLDREVVELRYNKVGGGIESAIRQQGHIIKGSLDTEVRQARIIVNGVNNLANRYIKGEVNRGNVEALARSTGDFLEKTDLVSPKDSDKKKMLEMLLKATQKDRLGRINPLISRIRARSAYLAASKRLIVQGFVVTKFETIRQLLLYERETTRWILEDAINQLNIYVLGTTTFRWPGKADTETQRRGISTVLATISEGLRGSIRVKPYLQPATTLADNLISVSNLVGFSAYTEAESLVESSTASVREVLMGYADIEKAPKS